MISESIEGDRAAEAEIGTAVEFGLAGDELASGFVRQVGVERAADDSAHRPPRLEPAIAGVGDGIERIVKPLPDVSGHLSDAVGRRAGGEIGDGSGIAETSGAEVARGIEDVSPRESVADAAAKLLGPAAGLLPFGGRRQSLADPGA